MTDWRKIASAQIDGTATPEERGKLEAWLRDRPENADDYVMWIDIHEALRARFGEADIRDRAVAPSSTPTPTPTPIGGLLAQQPLPFLATWSLGLAAMLVLTLWGTGLLSPDGGASRSARASSTQSSTSQAPPIDDVAATLTGAVDCKWDPGYEPIRYGEPLASGTILRLTEGLAQVTYETGAKVVIRGPCEFHVEGPSQGILPIGQLTAVVPRRGVGFVVQTPCAEIVDLGTEFAVDVDQSGVSEVHVFKGEVVSRRRLRVGDPTSNDLHLVTHEAARYSPVDASIREFRADDSRFIREITPRLVESELPREPQKRGLALWMAADLLVKTDDDGGVYAWGDVLCGDNQVQDDALQPNPWERPTLVPGGMGGADAIRFDGTSSHLVTTPMVTGPSQTVLMVVRIPALQPSYHAGTLLNYNGPVHRDMSTRADRGVLQLGFGPRAGDRRSVEAFVYVGASARAGAVESDPIPEEDAVVVAYQYNMRKNLAALYINGKLEDEASAPAPASATSRRVFGRHGHLPKYFRGEIGEVLIYNRVLGPRELSQVTRYLSSKYETSLYRPEAM